MNLFEIPCSNTNFTIGDLLKTVRKKRNISQEELSKALDLKGGASTIKDIELNKRYPCKKLAEQLSLYFNLSSDFFFDDYLRTVDKIPEILKSYRARNNLTIKEACAKLNIGRTTLINWEHNKKQVNRQSFKLLKEHKVF